MKSPFPGMDPYLESRWGDVHTSLMTYTRNQIQGQLPGDLRARVDEQILVEDEDSDNRPQRWRPDVRVVERPNGAPRPGTPLSGVTVAEPMIVEFDEEPEIHRTVNIIDTKSGNRLVTAIEILSPTNKIDPVVRRSYRRKQRELRAGGVSLVEIDLIRAGGYLSIPTVNSPSENGYQYRACVFRGWNPGQAEVFHLPLRERLPAIRVPLRPTDSDVVLDLQALIDSAYVDGGYDDISYGEEPDPHLSLADAAWRMNCCDSKASGR